MKLCVQYMFLILIFHIVLNDFNFESTRGDLKRVTSVSFEVVYS